MRKSDTFTSACVRHKGEWIRREFDPPVTYEEAKAVVDEIRDSIGCKPTTRKRTKLKRGLTNKGCE